MDFSNMDWFYWLIIALSLIELACLAVIIAKWPPHQEFEKSKATHPFFVPDDVEIK